MNDTIFALATAPGRAAVAVVRLSGPGTGAVLARLARPALEPRRAALRKLVGVDGEVIDDALVLWFPGPASYTGEDCAELQVHGGRAVISALSATLADLGLRPAEPGEFTRRAFQNGKLDLTQAEAVADLVDAESDAQRRQALAQLDGALGQRHERWRAVLIESLAWLEAEIDFPDEDVPGGLAARVRPGLSDLIGELDGALADSERGERVRDGWRVAIIGAPNAGKSSLLNGLARRDAAIVTAIPGTTRDIIEVSLDLGGFRVVLADTAGVHATSDPVEIEGVRRARAWAEGAALRIWTVDASASAGAWSEAVDLVRPGDMLLLNKSDLAEGSDADPARAFAKVANLTAFSGSAPSETALDALVRALTDRVVSALAGEEFPAVTRLRHRRRLVEARDHLARALTALDQGPELAAEDLRLAARALGRITGRIDPEDVLDLVFATFCIGK